MSSMSSPLAIGISIVIGLVVVLTLSKVIFIPLVNRYAPLRRTQAEPGPGGDPADSADDDPYSEEALESLIGRTAEVVVVLRPSGRVRVDGDIFEARASLGFVDTGAQVKIIDVDGYFLVVDKIEP